MLQLTVMNLLPDDSVYDDSDMDCDHIQPKHKNSSNGDDSEVCTYVGPARVGVKGQLPTLWR